MIAHQHRPLPLFITGPTSIVAWPRNHNSEDGEAAEDLTRLQCQPKREDHAREDMAEVERRKLDAANLRGLFEPLRNTAADPGSWSEGLHKASSYSCITGFRCRSESSQMEDAALQGGSCRSQARLDQNGHLRFPVTAAAGLHSHRRRFDGVPRT